MLITIQHIRAVSGQFWDSKADLNSTSRNMGKTGKGSSSRTGKADDAGGDKSALGTCSQVKVRHILCEKHSKIMEALAKIQAGEKFDAVASAMSEDAARKGGDLGWKRRTELVGPFAEAAFKLQVGQMSEPIKTQFGYHLILCDGRKA